MRRFRVVVSVSGAPAVDVMAVVLFLAAPRLTGTRAIVWIGKTRARDRRRTARRHVFRRRQREISAVSPAGTAARPKEGDGKDRAALSVFPHPRLLFLRHLMDDFFCLVVAFGAGCAAKARPRSFSARYLSASRPPRPKHSRRLGKKKGIGKKKKTRSRVAAKKRRPSSKRLAQRAVDCKSIGPRKKRP